MSASSKKKLRNAERAEQLTEKQLAEQKEAKKLKIFTIVMVAAVVLMVVFAVGIAVYNSVILPMEQEKEAEAHRSTVAATVGEHEINAVEYNCFYVDAVSNFYSQYGSYASLVGLDVTTALDKQQYDEETTWANYFKTQAENNIKSVYAIYDDAKANGFELTEDDKNFINTQMNNMAYQALTAGFPNVQDYLTAMYGTGANQETVRAYFETCYTAQMYQTSVAEALEYTDADLQAKDDEDPAEFSNFSYNSYYMMTSKFLQGGTEGEDGTVVYSDAEKAAAAAAAEEAAKALTAEGITTVEALDAAIAALSINAESEKPVASTPYTDYAAGYIPSQIYEWVTDESRQEGDLAYLPSATTAEDGTETINGYYIVRFTARNDNDVKMQNVRHILAAFEGGTTDTNGNKTYSDEEKAAAKAEADAIYTEWKNGDATEDSFAALANEKSDDGDGTTGGLYSDIYPGQMVPEFEDWCFAAHAAGDTGIVETTYGYHIMYYVGASEQTYRDYLIENTLRSEDVNAWHEALVAELTVTGVNYEFVPTGMILSPSSSY